MCITQRENFIFQGSTHTFFYYAFPISTSIFLAKSRTELFCFCFLFFFIFLTIFLCLLRMGWKFMGLSNEYNNNSSSSHWRERTCVQVGCWRGWWGCKKWWKNHMWFYLFKNHFLLLLLLAVAYKSILYDAFSMYTHQKHAPEAYKAA